MTSDGLGWPLIACLFISSPRTSSASLTNLLCVADQNPEIGIKTIGASLGVTQSSPVFGEMAIIDGSTRMAAAVTAIECKLLVLHENQFASCMQVHARPDGV